MSELSTRGRVAVAALQGDTASEAAEARVRARLSTLGVAVMASGASASLVGSAAAASAAPSMAPAAIAGVGGLGTSASAAPAALAATGTTGVAGASMAPTAGVLAGGGLVGGVGVLTKLASVPVALKASALLALVAGAGAVALPAARVQPTAHTEPARAPQQLETSVPHVEMKLPSRNSANAQPVQATDLSAQAGAEGSVAPVAGTARETRATSVHTALAGARATQSTPPRASRAAAEAPGSTLAAEGALLATALRALRAGQRAHAHDLLDQHERVFGPHALLARERERMREELSQTLR
jgi:hypothetical protein